VIFVYGFIPNHLFYDNCDAANGVSFEDQRSLPFFSSGFSLETLARLFYFICLFMLEFVILHGIYSRWFILEVSPKDL
jgi:hypothetical protein